MSNSQHRRKEYCQIESIYEHDRMEVRSIPENGQVRTIDFNRWPQNVKFCEGDIVAVTLDQFDAVNSIKFICSPEIYTMSARVYDIKINERNRASYSVNLFESFSPKEPPSKLWSMNHSDFAKFGGYLSEFEQEERIWLRATLRPLVLLNLNEIFDCEQWDLVGNSSTWHIEDVNLDQSGLRTKERLCDVRQGPVPAPRNNLQPQPFNSSSNNNNRKLERSRSTQLGLNSESSSMADSASNNRSHTETAIAFVRRVNIHTQDLVAYAARYKFTVPKSVWPPDVIFTEDDEVEVDYAPLNGDRYEVVAIRWIRAPNQRRFVVQIDSLKEGCAFGRILGHEIDPFTIYIPRFLFPAVDNNHVQRFERGSVCQVVAIYRDQRAVMENNRDRWEALSCVLELENGSTLGSLNEPQRQCASRRPEEYAQQQWEQPQQMQQHHHQQQQQMQQHHHQQQQQMQQRQQQRLPERAAGEQDAADYEGDDNGGGSAFVMGSGRGRQMTTASGLRQQQQQREQIQHHPPVQAPSRSRMVRAVSQSHLPRAAPAAATVQMHHHHHHHHHQQQQQQQQQQYHHQQQQQVQQQHPQQWQQRQHVRPVPREMAATSELDNERPNRTAQARFKSRARDATWRSQGNIYE